MYVHWNNFLSPEGLSGLFSYMCWNPVYSACRTIMQPCALAAGPPGKNGSQLPITLSYLSLMFSSHSISLCHPDPSVAALVHIIQANKACGELLACWIAALYILGSRFKLWIVAGISLSLPLSPSLWVKAGHLRPGGTRKDDLSFVVSGLPACSASS